MINSDKYFTIIYRDLTVDERRKLLDNPKWSASGYSHAFDDRDGLLSALVYLEDFLTKLIDLIVWPPSSETKEKLQKEIADIQRLMKMHGRLPKNHRKPEKVQEYNTPHPVTPSSQRIRDWVTGYFGENTEELQNTIKGKSYIATVAAQWGADQELEACCEWLRNNGLYETRIGHLREARRPKVPTLQEKALDILEKHGELSPEEHDAIETALKNLPEQL